MLKRIDRLERGQSLVEFALALPILIIILSGLLDVGRVYFTYIALEEATAEAALYLAINPRCPDDTDPQPSEPGNPCADPNNATFRAVSAGNQEIDWSLATIIPYVPPSAAVSEIVRVEIRYPYEFITPGINAIAQGVTGGGGLVLRVVATHVIMFKQSL